MVARRTIRNSMPAILMLAAGLLCSVVSAVRMSGGNYVEFKYHVHACDMFVYLNLLYHTNLCTRFSHTGAN